MSDALSTARDLVSRSSRILALTGAGLSTASGIPDFRGPQGRWTQDPDAEKVSVLSYYLGDEDIRRKAWQIRATSPHWDAAPNAGHLALVELERAGKLSGIVTQNTDGLHLVAGSSPELVHEVHGNARRWRCEDCGTSGAMEQMRELVLAGDTDPRCPECDGITRATVILFEEMLEPDVLNASVALAEEADLVLAIGTTLTVHPVAGLVPYAFGHSARVVIVNNQETPYDYLADAVLRDPIEEVLPALVAPDA
ncbi:MAG: Sir2 family NAD-dependent protein deacetylase [Propionibacteriaceae bacterium]|nr:Sir2 family NAD-dependent protein deacetylase [Propionibacteriaceae bacterium]